MGIAILSGCASSSSTTQPAAPREQGGAPAMAKAPPLAPAEAAGTLLDAKAQYARRRLVRGLTSARLGDFAEAAEHYKQGLEAVPEDPTLLSALSDAQAAQGDLSTALYHARLARAADTAQVHYHRRLAQLYRQADRPEKALATYERLLERFPEDTEAQRAQARLQVQQDRPRAALRSYQALAETAPASSPDLLSEMLALHRALGDSAGVERTLRTLVQQVSTSNKHRRALARFYRAEGRVPDALPLLEEALQLHPDDAQAASLLAKTYRATGHPAKAAALEEDRPGRAAPLPATASAGAPPATLVERARPLYRRAVGTASGDSASTAGEAADAALRLLEKALAEDSTHAGALAMLGTLRFRAGAFDEAAPLLHRSLETNPRFPTRWLQAAEAFLRAGRPKRAAAVADEGLLLFPGQLPLLRVYATALMRMRHDAAAIRRFEEALRVMQEDGLLQEEAHAEQAAHFHAALGRLYARQDEETEADRHYEQALPLARQAVERAPEDAAALGTLGAVLFARGQLAEAKRALRAAIETGKADALVYKYYGDVAAARNDTRAARTYWRQALDRGYESNALRQKLGTASH